MVYVTENYIQQQFLQYYYYSSKLNIENDMCNICYYLYTNYTKTKKGLPSLKKNYVKMHTRQTKTGNRYSSHYMFRG